MSSAASAVEGIVTLTGFTPNLGKLSMAALCNVNGLAAWRHAENSLQSLNVTMDPSRKSGGALHRLHCFCLEFDGACEVQRRVPTDWIIEPVDVSGYGSFSLAS